MRPAAAAMSALCSSAPSSADRDNGGADAASAGGVGGVASLAASAAQQHLMHMALRAHQAGPSQPARRVIHYINHLPTLTLSSTTVSNTCCSLRSPIFRVVLTVVMVCLSVFQYSR